MKKNVGSIDKIVRIVIAVVAGYFAYNGNFESAVIGYVLWAVAAIMLVTSLIGTCPLYSIFGIKSNK